MDKLAGDRNQFTFFRSYYEVLAELPEAEFKAAVMAICAFALDGAEPELTGLPSTIFRLIRPVLESGRRRAKGNALSKTTQKASKTRAMSAGGNALREETPLSEGNSLPKGKPLPEGNSLPDRKALKEQEKDMEMDMQMDMEMEKEQEKETEQEAQTQAGTCLAPDWEAAFMGEYPKNRLGDPAAARRELGAAITTASELALARRNLRLWLRSEQWAKEGGRYIPYLTNWIRRGQWQSPPREPPQGGGELGQAELEAIAQMLRQERR